MDKIRKFFSPPFFADEESQHQAWLLHTLLWSLMLAVTVIEVVDIFLLPENATRWWLIIVAVDTINLFLMALNHRGFFRLASVLLVAEVWLIVTLLVLNGGGVYSPATAVYLLVVFGAGLLLGQRAGIIIGCLCSLTTLSLVVLENTGRLPVNVVHDTAISLWFAQFLYITMMISLQFLAARTIQKALSRARIELGERKRGEKVLVASENRYRILVEQTGQIVYDYDVATGKLKWSGAIAHVTGFTTEEFQSVDIKTWEEMIHPEDRPVAMASFETAMESASNYRAEYRFRCKDGSYIFISDHGLFLADASGKSTRMLGTMSDITPRKRAEAENQELTRSLEKRVRKRTAELEVANKELEAFSYSVSHDLRAPLRHIKSFAQILVEDYGEQVPGEALDFLEKIEGDTERMEQLIEDLLAFSKAGRQNLEKICIDLNPLVRQIATDLQSHEKKRQIDVRINPLSLCFGDASLLKQVFFNLIQNAFKFTRDRSPGQIEISCTTQGAENIYSVRDNGAGFDMQYADKLFGAFQRLHGEKEFEGTGIGLSIVQRIIHRHDGRIWAESVVEQGATFYFTLPACPQPGTTPANGVGSRLLPLRRN